MAHSAARVLGLALLLGSVASFGSAAYAAPGMVVSSAPAQQATPLELFRPLMPTLTSPRCFNCHGGTDPVTGANHGGGAVGSGAACGECHTAQTDLVDGVLLGPWRDVSGIAFDQQLLPMCQTLRHVVQVIGPEQFMNVVAADEVVGLGFQGLRGMDDASPFWPIQAAPPPMARDVFVAAAQRWITEGHAECTAGGWTGTIVQTTNLHSGTPGNELTTDITITVNVDGDNSTASVHLTGTTVQDGATVNGCKTYNHETFSVDANVPAKVAVTVMAPVSGDGLPDLPADFALPPGVPDPRTGLFTITFGISGTVNGAHHIETQAVINPPKFQCEHTIKDPPYARAFPGGSIVKSLQGDDTKHLVGSDTQITEGSTVKTSWDLSSD